MAEDVFNVQESMLHAQDAPMGLDLKVEPVWSVYLDVVDPVLPPILLNVLDAGMDSKQIMRHVHDAQMDVSHVYLHSALHAWAAMF